MKKVILVYFLFFSQSSLFCYTTSPDEESFLDDFAPLRKSIIDSYYNFLKKVDDTLCANEDLNNKKLEKSSTKINYKSSQHSNITAMMSSCLISISVEISSYQRYKYSLRV